MQRRGILLGTAAGLLVLMGAGCGGDGSEGIGQPADKTAPHRIVDIRQLDGNRFQPSNVEVVSGETVKLRITNGGTQMHDFFLGDEKAHEARKKEMSAMGSSPMDMPDTANSVTVAPGATEVLAWTFPKSGKVTFGCHQPGHDEAGMEGTVEVKPVGRLANLPWS